MDEERKYCVYVHINKINGKCYVGETSNIKRRWQSNGLEYQKSTYFYHAIQKYGWDNFEHIILKDGLTKLEAYELEKYYIEYYHSMYNEYGYNVREGGNGPLGEVSKEILSQKAKERGLWKGNLNPRHLDPLFNERNGMYGKHHTEETKKKISDAKKGKPISEERKAEIKEFMNTKHPRAKKVRCIETGEVFLSSRKAAEAYGLGNSTVSRACNGQRKIGGGYHWEWYTDETNK